MAETRKKRGKRRDQQELGDECGHLTHLGKDAEVGDGCNHEGAHHEGIASLRHRCEDARQSAEEQQSRGDGRQLTRVPVPMVTPHLHHLESGRHGVGQHVGDFSSRIMCPSCN